MERSPRSPGKFTGLNGVVVGASSGIGWQTAIRLAANGASLALLARRASLLVELAGQITSSGGSAVPHVCDITDPERAERVVVQVASQFERIDFVINSAGLMLLGPAADAPLEEWRRMVDVNTIGLLNLSHYVLPHLVRAAAAAGRGVADLVNICSIAGRRAFPSAAGYNLTKFGMAGFSDALRQEYAKLYVRVSTIDPGTVDTPLPTHNRPEVFANRAKAFAGVTILTADDVAAAVEFILAQPRHAAVDQLVIRPTMIP